MKRGEIRWYSFSHPDKKRPVIVLTRDSILPYLDEITVAQVTSRIRDIPSEVLLSKHDGMPRDCVINCDQLHTVSKRKIGALITTLSASKMPELAKALKFALDI